MNMNTSMNTIFFCKKMNEFSFNLNKYICEYDYIYFRFYFHSALLLARALKLFVSASGTCSVPIELYFLMILICL